MTTADYQRKGTTERGGGLQAAACGCHPSEGGICMITAALSQNQK